MIFRKEFAFLGVIFGCFIFASMAFPGGVVQSSANGTVNIPNVKALGGWNATIIFFLFMALIMLGTILMTGIVLASVRLKNLEEVAIAYNVGVTGLKGMTPMQAAQMLNGRNETRDLIVENASSQSSIGKTGGQSRLRSRGNNDTIPHWL
jgi:hypothetical protein